MKIAARFVPTRGFSWQERVERCDSGNGRRAHHEASCGCLVSPDFVDVATSGSGTGKGNLTSFKGLGSSWLVKTWHYTIPIHVSSLLQ